jgi:hypothetical protein
MPYHAVIIKHGKYLTTYSNLDKVTVKSGQKIQAGEMLGKAAIGVIEFISYGRKKKPRPRALAQEKIIIMKGIIFTLLSGLIAISPPGETSKGGAGRWIGIYAALGDRITYVADSTFIRNGIAKLDNSPYDYYFIGYRLNIPDNKKYSADNMKLVARVKNPIDEGALEELDVGLLLGGTKDTVHVNYVGRAHRQDCTILGVYNTDRQLRNEGKLVQLFEEWTTVALEVKDGVLYTYRNNKLIKSYNLRSTRLGNLTMIQIGFKGVGSVDWVKVYDRSGKVRLKEEFGLNKSNVEYFDFTDLL